MTAVWINEKPLDELVAGLTAHPGWMDSPVYDFEVSAVPGSVGGIISDVPTSAGRSFSLSAVAEPSAVTDRATFVASLHRRLKGLLEIRTSDHPDKVIECVFTGAEVEPERGEVSFVEPDVIVTMEFLAPSGHKRDRYQQSAAFGSTRTEVPLGDLPSAGTLYIMGAATDPTVTYRAATGDSVDTLGFTITLAADDYLKVDLSKREITKVVSGTETVDASLKTSGNWFVPDPVDGSGEWSDWPTLEVDAGQGVLYYHRNWSS